MRLLLQQYPKEGIVLNSLETQKSFGNTKEPGTSFQDTVFEEFFDEIISIGI